MYNGVSAIQATQQQMDVIGNNISNVDTTGFKSSSASFADQLSQTLQGGSAGTSTVGGTNPMQIGLGTKLGSTNLNMQQGTLTSTNSPTDMAIQGNGFFMLADPTGSIDYTRDGNFALDSQGYLVDSNTGEYVLGWQASATGVINNNQTISSADKLSIPVGSLTAAEATSAMSWNGNLSADDAAAATYTDNVTVYDNLGEPHDLTIQFTRGGNGATPPSPTNTWTWQVVGDKNANGTSLSDFTTPTGTTNQGTITFNGSGDVSASTGSVQLNPTDGSTTPQNITVNFSSLTQLSGNSTAGPQSQNGYATGTLESFNVNASGVITGTFSNGLSQSLGQIALANFANPAGLESIGNNQYTVSPNSGGAVVGPADSQGLGSISPGYLESSNVDLGTELTNMIVAQRSFEANTKIVSTVDQMLSDLVNMVQG